MREVSVSEVIERISETVSASKIPPQSIVLGLENVQPNSGLLEIGRLPTSEQIRSNKSKFYPGDILFGKLRPTLRKVTVVDFPGFCSPELLVLRPLESIDTWYLWYILRSELLTNQIETRIIGASIPRINPQELMSLSIPWPDKEIRVDIGLKAQRLFEIRNKLSVIDELLQRADQSLISKVRTENESAL